MSEMHKLTSYSDGFGIFNKVAEDEFDVDNKNYLRLFMLNTETCNEQVIGLQKHGFLREQALLLTKNPYSAFVAYLDGQLKISSEIFEVSDEDMLETLGTVRINYPEIFVDGESE